MAAPRWCGWLSAAVVALDQATKYLAETLLVMHQPVPVLPSFNWMLAYNTGAAFSFLRDAGGWQRWLFLSLSTLVSIGLIVWLWRLKPHEKRLGAALALILGGALGNLIDRAWLGHVIDFIQLYYDRWYWPTFNVADSAITVGAVLLVLDSLFSKEAATEKNPVDGF
ncbi:MAG: lipoprotein signal peptidase [Candidatus Competibacteraceae bacterium]|nr:lipoprotein signal peptidase [Candidatus Competibacteraceae bacterium]MBK7984062.1 lipoprotein signal peptidase [Candidatus Competibacteraceae bacterium]MBK8896039.1 lipoprotein signal peptidase [Candidatus Competibacteraceae bacterium]MBK8963547.1 lipoprotein signal peptidase [Candidatus Competibacteraceae bacterium]MBK9950440.1 lipoprotein signal peptidase [Candidatus Competibacteraceae bacterium]